MRILLLVLLSVFASMIALSAASPVIVNAHAESGNNSDASVAAELKTSDHAFVDDNGFTNIVGLVNNHSTMPISVVVALDTRSGDGKITTLYQNPYGSAIYPAGGAPYKFKLSSDIQAVGKPYLAKTKFVSMPFYNSILLNYTNMAVGEGKVLSGTMKNIGNSELHNVFVYASVHNEKMIDLDSVKSEVVPILKPGQEVVFTAAPDPAVKAQVYYYSCAGLAFDEPISTLPTGDGGFIAYDFTSIAKVSNMRYDNTTNSIDFGITHYNPKGGQATLKIPQFSQNQTVTIIMDGQPSSQAVVKADGKTVSIDFFVPPGPHEVQIQGVRNVPEFPFAPMILAAIVSMVIGVGRFKAAFKMS